MKTILHIILGFYLTFFTIQVKSAPIFSTAPSAAQISQFKAMSPSVQQAVANKAGVNLNQIKERIGQSSQTSSVEEAKLSIEQRDVEDDDSQDEDKEKADSELNYFGYNLFAGEPLTLSPLNDLPVPSDYILASGDEVNVQLYGKQNQKYNFIINREGEIEFDNIGPVNVAGLSFSELRAKIKVYVAKKMIGIEANVTMGKLRSMQILVLHQVTIHHAICVGQQSGLVNGHN